MTAANKKKIRKFTGFLAVIIAIFQMITLVNTVLAYSKGEDITTMFSYSNQTLALVITAMVVAAHGLIGYACLKCRRNGILLLGIFLLVLDGVMNYGMTMAKLMEGALCAGGWNYISAQPFYTWPRGAFYPLAWCLMLIYAWIGFSKKKDALQKIWWIPGVCLAVYYLVGNYVSISLMCKIWPIYIEAGSVDMILTNVIDIVIMSVAAGGYCAEALGLGKWLYCGGKPCRKKQAAEQDTKLVND